MSGGYYTRRHRATCAQLVNHLIANGWVHAEHRAREGEDQDRGDIAGLPGLVIEVKVSREPRFNQWLDQLDAELTREHQRTGHPAEGLIVWRKPGETNPDRWIVVRRLGNEIAARQRDEQFDPGGADRR